MSGIKVPDLKPGQDINFNEAVSMLDASTAAQEESLARLNDIEQKKVTYILKNIGDGAQAAGVSVEEMMDTIEKYRLLLEMKQRRTRQLVGFPEPLSLSPPAVQFSLPEPKSKLRPSVNPGYQTGNEFRLKLDNQTGNEFRFKLDNQTGNEFRFKLENQTGDEFRLKLDNHAGNEIRPDLDDQAENEINLKLESLENELEPEHHSRYGFANEFPKEPVLSGQKMAPGRFSVPKPIAPVPSAAAVSPAAAIRPCRQLPGAVGMVKGVVSNPDDAFFGRIAVLRVFIPGADIAGQSVSYTVNGEDGGIRFYAAGRHLKTTCPDGSRNVLVISGEGTIRIRRSDLPECSGKAVFTLVLRIGNSGLEFSMKINPSDECPAHDSGIVKVKYAQSDMCLRFC